MVAVFVPEEEVGPPLHPGDYVRVCLRSGLTCLCKNESDWLISRENTCPMIPEDAVKCTITPRAWRITLERLIIDYWGLHRFSERSTLA